MVSAFEPAGERPKVPVLRPRRWHTKPAIEFVRENLRTGFTHVPGSFRITVRVRQEIDGRLLVQIRKGQAAARRVDRMEPVQEGLLCAHHCSCTGETNHSL